MDPRSQAPVVSLFAALAFASVLAGCAGLPVSDAARNVSAEAFEIPSPAGISLEDAGVIALDDDMRAFLVEEVGDADDHTRLRRLARAIVDNTRFHLEYDEDTRTAAGTFRARRGNCLSFTNLFVGMARELGLPVSYQEVDIPPVWLLRNDSFVLSRHVNAIVTLPGEPPYVVDFNMAEFHTAYPRRPISDARAGAHYWSNLGIERMQAGDAAEALADFRRALALDRTLAQAWVNLGAWYRREGAPALAEAAYLAALRVSPQEHVAMSGLAKLHEQQGRPELARWFLQRVARYQLQNPYYRFELAKAAVRDGDWIAAERHLREAIRRNGEEAEFHSLLGLVYRHEGKEASARRALLRAVELADDDALRSAYRRKLELLGGHSQGS